MSRWCFVTFLFIIHNSICFDPSKFTNPSKAEFYQVNRHFNPESTPFRLLPNITISNTSIAGVVVNEKENVTLNYTIRFYLHGIFRFSLCERKGCHLRQEVDNVLINKLAEAVVAVEQADDFVLITFDSYQLRITFSTFLFELLDTSGVILEINRHKLFNFAHFPVENVDEVRDAKPLGLEFSFLRSKAVYGLPERATSFRLPMTRFAPVSPCFPFHFHYFPYPSFSL
jgi:hypothetical protein